MNADKGVGSVYREDGSNLGACLLEGGSGKLLLLHGCLGSDSNCTSAA